MVTLRYIDADNSTYECNIQPRDYERFTDLTMTMVEVATNLSITCTDLAAYDNGDDTVCFTFVAATKLKARNQYKIVIYRDGDLFWRGMADVKNENTKDEVKQNMKIQAGEDIDDLYGTVNRGTDFVSRIEYIEQNG